MTLVGRPSARARAALAAGLRVEADDCEVTCFASYSPATFAVGTVFGAVFSTERPDAWASTECRLLGVTQEFGARWAEIPAGWRTVCVLRFPRGVPELIKGLPMIDSWSQGQRAVGLCTEDTALQIAQRAV